MVRYRRSILLLMLTAFIGFWCFGLYGAIDTGWKNHGLVIWLAVWTLALPLLAWKAISPDVILVVEADGVRLGGGGRELVIARSDLKGYYLNQRSFGSSDGYSRPEEALNLVVWYHAHIDRLPGSWRKDGSSGEITLFTAVKYFDEPKWRVLDGLTRLLELPQLDAHAGGRRPGSYPSSV